VVFVLDRKKKPLMPCSEKRARKLLEKGRAVVVRVYPFTIRLKDRKREDSNLQPVRVCLDPGSKVTGIAAVREDNGQRAVLSLIELKHRGGAIKSALTQRRSFRRNRRNKLWHRPARFDNRTRPQGWLAPSLRHRVDTVISWVNRFRKWLPVTALSQEIVRFDAQVIQNPEISGIEYRQGELAGYEVREYLFEKWNRTCAYCGNKDVLLEIDHIHPKSKGGTDRVSNLTLACHGCNQKKGNLDVKDFLKNKPERLNKILAQAQAPLKDAAAVNSTMWSLFNRLKNTGLPVEIGTGGRTKWNRTRLGIPKTHCLDAACVGKTESVIGWDKPVLEVKATGRGSYQRTRLDKYGFPRGYLTRKKKLFGFQTGDTVKSVVTAGKKAGIYAGRVAVRASGSFNVQTADRLIQSLNYRFFTLVQRADGYGYNYNFNF
jgi:hypothetical protein